MLCASFVGPLQGTADFVSAALVLHCIPEADCQKLLKNAFKILKPGGMLYGTTAGQAEAREWTYTTDGKGVGMLYSQVGETCHEHILTPSDIP